MRNTAIHCQVTSSRMSSLLLWSSPVESSEDFREKEDAGFHPRNLRVLRKKLRPRNHEEEEMKTKLRGGRKAQLLELRLSRVGPHLGPSAVFSAQHKMMS